MINFAHSFWSKPLFEKKFERYFSFENAVKNTLLDYAYSASLVHKFGHNITLYADKNGIELLSFIPYNNIVEIDIEDNEPMHFAAQPKFYAMKKMNLGDVLIDGDIFIETNNIYEEIEASKTDVLYSFIESNDLILDDTLSKDPIIYYEKLLPKFHDTLYKVPEITELTYPNTSLLKISNAKVKDDYIKQYFHHKDILNDVDWEYTWPDLIIEQYFLWEVAKCHSMTPLIKDYVNVDEEHKGFMHLGSGKTKFQNQVRQKLYFLDKNIMIAANKKAIEIINESKQ